MKAVIILATTALFGFSSVVLKAQDAPKPPTWMATLGAAVVASPSYPGSDEYRVIPFPMIQLSWKNRITAGPSTSGIGAGLGVWPVQTRKVGIALELGIGDNRPEDRADALAGMDDRDLQATAGAALSYRPGPFELTLGVTRGLNDGGGLTGNARLGYTAMLGKRLIMTPAASVSLADARQLRREFGVTPTEATRRAALIAAGDGRLEPGDGRSYRPGGGLRNFGGSLTLVYLISPRWSLVGFGGLDALAHELERSPLVRRQSQWWGGGGIGFRL